MVWHQSALALSNVLNILQITSTQASWVFALDVLAPYHKTSLPTEDMSDLQCKPGLCAQMCLIELESGGLVSAGSHNPYLDAASLMPHAVFVISEQLPQASVPSSKYIQLHIVLSEIKYFPQPQTDAQTSLADRQGREALLPAPQHVLCLRVRWVRGGQPNYRAQARSGGGGVHPGPHDRHLGDQWRQDHQHATGHLPGAGRS